MENFRVNLKFGENSNKTVKIESSDKELLLEVVASILNSRKEGSKSSKDIPDGYCEELNKSFESVKESKKSLEEAKKRFEEGHRERSERLDEAIRKAEEAIKENGKSIVNDIKNAQPKTYSINEVDNIVKGLDDAFEENRKEIRKELDDLFATLDSMKD